MDPMISLLGIIIGIVIFVFLAFKGVHVLVSSILMAALVALISGLDVYKTLTDTYMKSFVGFTTSYLLLFTFSSLFGKLVTDSGIAYSVSKLIADGVRKSSPKNQMFLAVLSLPIICAILTISGISLFVVVFTLVAIARSLFKELNVPWHYYTCSTFGTGTITMAFIPGSPQALNLIPPKYFGTDAMAAPVLGILSALFMTVLMLVYVKWQTNRSIKNGEGFLPTGAEIDKTAPAIDTNKKPHNIIRCLIPLATTVVCLNIFKMPAVVSLTVACVVNVVMFYNEFNVAKIKAALNEGLIAGIMPTVNISAASAFGAVVAAVPGFTLIKSGLASIPGSPIIQLAVAMIGATVICASASAGMPIVLDAMAPQFMASGINPQILHRVACIAAIGGGSPHGGSLFNTLTVTKLSHSTGYRHYFWILIVGGLLGTIFAVFLAILGVC